MTCVTELLMGEEGRASGPLHMLERRAPVKTSVSQFRAQGIVSFQKYILTINARLKISVP